MSQRKTYLIQYLGLQLISIEISDILHSYRYLAIHYFSKQGTKAIRKTKSYDESIGLLEYHNPSSCFNLRFI